MVPGPSQGSTTTVHLAFYVSLTRNYLNIKIMSISRQHVPKHKWIQVSIGLNDYPKIFGGGRGGNPPKGAVFFSPFFKNNYHTAALAVAKPGLLAGCLIDDPGWGTTGPH